MSIIPTECVHSLELERIASGATPSLAQAAHLSECAACQNSLERIRADNQFLAAFANAAGLPALPTQADAAAAFPTVQIPGYQIIREIRRGGQGVVYHAIQRSTRRDVAIKIMKQGLFASLADRARFDREIETLSRLNHPNIVAVHDAGVADGFSYFVMNYVDGQSLDECFRHTQPFPESAPDPDPNSAEPLETTDAPRPATVNAILDLFTAVCDAVHAAHLRGVIHRDLKPSNIRVDRAGRPHVLDFGLAKSADYEQQTTMTNTGQFVGSLPWASPEQVEGSAAKIDLRTDVYSLGVILFQLLTGRLPFDIGTNLRSAIDSILFHDPPRPSTVAAPPRPRIDDELDTIVLKCLSKDRDRRYQTAGELARDIRHYRANEPIEAKRDSALYILRKTLRRYKLRVAAAGAFVVLLGVFSVVMFVLYRRSSTLEHQATQSADTLARLLSESNIEKGRMVGLLGNLQQAEELLWREMLLSPAADSAAQPRINTPPGPPEAYWALWELYRRIPCLRSWKFDSPAARTATLAADGESLWVWSAESELSRMDARGRIVSLGPFGARGAGMISPDGRLASDATFDHYFIYRRDRSESPAVQFSRTNTYDIGRAIVSRRGNIAAVLVDGKIVVWDSRGDGRTSELGDGARFSAVAISMDESRLAARKSTGELLIFDIASGRRVSYSDTGAVAREPVRWGGPLLFSQDDRWLADIWMATSGRVWNLEADPPTFVDLSEAPGDYPLVDFSPDGSRLAVGDLGARMRVFDAATGSLLKAWVASSARMRSVEFSRDGTHVWTCGDEELRLWELSSKACVRSASFPDESLHCVAFSPDGSEIFVSGSGSSGKAYRFEPGSLRTTPVEFAKGEIVATIAVSPDGKHIAAGSYSNAAYLWHGLDITQTPMRLEHPLRVSHLCFSPDSRRFATAGDDHVTRLWDTLTGTLERELRGATDRIPFCTFDHAGRRLLAVGRDGCIRTWDVATGASEVWQAPDGVPLRAACFSEDDRWLVVGGAGRTVDIWDAQSRNRVHSLKGHSQEIFCLDISAGGELIASGDSAGAIRIWHFALRRPLVTLDGHTSAVMSVRFSPREASLASASLDGSVRIWSLDYFQRHIAGQVQAWLTRLHVPDDPLRAAWIAWAEQRIDPNRDNASTRP